MASRVGFMSITLKEAVSVGAPNQILFGTDTIRVEFFPSKKAERSNKIAFTFSAATNRRLDGNFDGGSVLARHGFDVIAFKTISDDWFQSLPEQALDIVAAFSACGGYTERVAYGTSAGGFASIAFSKLLRCTKVLAISPQYSIREEFDTRWKWFADPLEWRHNITAETVARECKFIWVYDNRSIDIVHIENINRTIGNPKAISEIHMPYVGHNVGVCLNEIGALKKIPIDILIRGVDLRKLTIRLNKTKKISTIYLNNLSVELIKKAKIKTAVAVMRRGYDIDPNFMINFHYEPAMIYQFIHSMNADIQTCKQENASLKASIAAMPRPKRLFDLVRSLFSWP